MDKWQVNKDTTLSPSYYFSRSDDQAKSRIASILAIPEGTGMHLTSPSKLQSPFAPGPFRPAH